VVFARWIVREIVLAWHVLFELPKNGMQIQDIYLPESKRLSDPQARQGAGFAGDGIGCGEANLPDTLEDLSGRGGAADVPVFSGRIGADDEEVVRGGDAAVAGSGGKYSDITGTNGDSGSVLAP
jgi:hypothetical protein